MQVIENRIKFPKYGKYFEDLVPPFDYTIFSPIEFKLNPNGGLICNTSLGTFEIKQDKECPESVSIYGTDLNGNRGWYGYRKNVDFAKDYIEWQHQQNLRKWMKRQAKCK